MRQSTKFTIIRAIRATGLLKLADTCKYWIGRAGASARNHRFSERFPDFATPPPHLAFDALNHVDWHRYRESGGRHADMFARVLRETFPDREPIAILEWGCGPGRIIRHMPVLLSPRAHAVTGADYNARASPGVAGIWRGSHS